MAQYKKDQIKEIIDSAALEVFSQKGYLNTKITDISKNSGVSVGNIYRYYKGKEDIFYSVIPKDFFDLLKNKLTGKIAVWKDNHDSSSQSLISKELVSFIIDNRKLFLIIFGGCDGTIYENAKKEIIDILTDAFISNYLSKLNINLEENIDTIKLIYEKHFETISSAFIIADSEDKLRKMLQLINCYHVNGITSFISLNFEMEEN